MEQERGLSSSTAATAPDEVRSRTIHGEEFVADARTPSEAAAGEAPLIVHGQISRRDPSEIAPFLLEKLRRGAKGIPDRSDSAFWVDLACALYGDSRKRNLLTLGDDRKPVLTSDGKRLVREQCKVDPKAKMQRTTKYGGASKLAKAQLGSNENIAPDGSRMGALWTLALVRGWDWHQLRAFMEGHVGTRDHKGCPLGAYKGAVRAAKDELENVDTKRAEIRGKTLCLEEALLPEAERITVDPSAAIREALPASHDETCRVDLSARICGGKLVIDFVYGGRTTAMIEGTIIKNAEKYPRRRPQRSNRRNVYLEAAD